MPPGKLNGLNLKLIAGLSSIVALSVAVLISLTLFSCSKEAEKQQLKENLTAAAPVVSPMLSNSENITKGNDFFSSKVSSKMP